MDTQAAHGQATSGMMGSHRWPGRCPSLPQWRPDFRQDTSCLLCQEWALHVLALLLHEHIIRK